MKNKNINILFHTGNFDKIYYGLTTAAASLAVNINTKLFFTMEAIQSLTRNGAEYGWHKLATVKAVNAVERNKILSNLGLPGFEEILNSCIVLNGIFMVCESGLIVQEIKYSELRSDIKFSKGGLVTFFGETQNDSSLIFI